MCFNPRIIRRPSTRPDLPASIPKPSQHMSARARVKAEMQSRQASAGDGVLTSVRDLTFTPSEAEQVLPRVQQDLFRAFKLLASMLSDQTASFADTTVLVFCNRQLDEAMNAIQLSPEHRQVLDAREGELQALATKARYRLGKFQHCVTRMKQ